MIESRPRRARMMVFFFSTPVITPAGKIKLADPAHDPVLRSAAIALTVAT